MRRYALALIFFFSSVTYFTSPSYAANTDIWNLSGQGVYNGKDMVHVDSNYNFRIYNGSIVLGDNALTPSTTNVQTAPSITTGGFYGLKLPFVNGASTITANGMIIIASTTASGVQGSYGTFAATTTVLGIADGAYAPAAVGYMTVAGYALVLTTGTIKIGDLLVSTNTTPGRCGAGSGTIVVGTVIGKALTNGAAAGDSVLALISPQ